MRVVNDASRPLILYVMNCHGLEHDAAFQDYE